MEPRVSLASWSNRFSSVDFFPGSEVVFTSTFKNEPNFYLWVSFFLCLPPKATFIQQVLLYPLPLRLKAYLPIGVAAATKGSAPPVFA